MTFQFYENPLRFARWLRGWKTVALVPVSIGTSVAAIMVPVLTVEGTLAAEAQAAQNVNLPALKAARGQADPVNLLASKPIPAVAKCGRGGARDAPLPKVLVPDGATLAQENTAITYDTPPWLSAILRAGRDQQVCKLGDTSSNRVVAVLRRFARRDVGSRDAADRPGTALRGGGARQARLLRRPPARQPLRLAVRQLVPLGAPAGSQAAPGRDARRLQAERQPPREQPATTVAEARAVSEPGDPRRLAAGCPGQTRRPRPASPPRVPHRRSCSSPVAAPTRRWCRTSARCSLNAPALIPTLQWLCGDGVCPSVINHTLTTHDGDHLTMEYSADLAPLLRQMRRILARLG